MLFLVILTLSLACTLLDGQDPINPKPSLTKCYRFNTSACCVSAHDASIQDTYGSFLSSQCQREYDYLEDYFCFGCNPAQGDFTDEANKVIRICESYAKRLWNEDLLMPTKTFDNCGITTFWRDEPVTIVPSSEWANAYQFFWEVKPPFFEDYSIYIVNSDSDEDCYNVGLTLLFASLILVI